MVRKAGFFMSITLTTTPDDVVFILKGNLLHAFTLAKPMGFLVVVRCPAGSKKYITRKI